MTKQTYQSFGPEHDPATVARLFYERWGYHAQEILRVGMAHVAGPLADEDADLFAASHADRDPACACSIAKCA